MGDFISSSDMAEYTAFLARHYILAAVWVCSLVGLVYVQIRILTAGIKKLSAAKCTFIINHENGLFVDVRSAATFKGGHVPGSVNVPAADIRAGRYSISGGAGRKLIVVGRDKYDTDSFNSARILKKAGYNVASLDGGIAQWQSDNLPLSVK
ncbi:MAG: rhodanese-like domain-containing protein [Succinivibrio sp.]